MNHTVRNLSIIVALGLLVAVLGAGSVIFGPRTAYAAVITVAEDNVEFAASDGNDVTSAKPNSTSTLLIRDDALETTKSGTAAFSGIPRNSKFFNIASGFAGSSPGSTTDVTRVLTAPDYSTTSPWTTPLTGNPTASVGGSSSFVVGSDVDAGTFTLLVESSTTTTATFGYHTPDTYPGTDSALRRAKVISTSDPAGEWVTINEVASTTSATTANATSKLFSGVMFLSGDAAKQGAGDNSVWVQDGDTLTAQYYDSAGALIDSDTVTIDGVDPTIAAIVPGDGIITNVDNPTVTFEVTDTGSGISASDFSTDVTLKINGVTVDSSNISFQAIANGFRGIFAQGTAWTVASTSFPSGFDVTDSQEFSLEISATDQAGNTKTVSGADANITIDKTIPVLASARTGAANTTIVATFSDTSGLDPASIASDGSDFTLVGATISGAVVDATDGNKVNLTVSAMASDAKPTVKVSGSITDKAGNATDSTLDAITATDGVKAVLSTITVDKDLAILADKVTVNLLTDEKMAVDWPKVSIVGPAGATSNGLKTATSPTPNNFSADTTVVSGDTTGIYGVTIEGRDLGNNTTTNLTTVAAEIPTISGSVLTVANGPLGDVNVSGGVTAADVTVFVNGTTTGVSKVTAVDASARTITLAGLATTTLAFTVDYSYAVANDTFEIDQSAPTVTFDPANGTTVQSQSPFIRIIFDEDEYPGDSFKTVTLTKAELTLPDATTMDLLATFTSGDNIEFIWAATDLALGEYSLTVSGTDTAGNAVTDAAGKFTIAKRSVSLSLRPGWNLVSVPDSPAPDKQGVNDVFSSTKIDVVLTYDARANNWFRAVRQADGTLGLPESVLELKAIDGSKGYWVHSTDVLTVEVDVPGIAAGAAALPPSFKLVAGWNLVPYATSDLTITKRDADDYFTGLNWSRAFRFDNASNKFVGILPNDIDKAEDNITIGNGYWVFLNAAGTLVP